MINSMTTDNKMNLAHYDKNCLCPSCKQAGNRRYIGGGVYNIHNEKQMTTNNTKQWEERFDDLLFELQEIDDFSRAKIKSFIQSEIDQAIKERETEIERDLGDIIWNKDGSLKSYDITDIVSSVVHYFSKANNEVDEIPQFKGTNEALDKLTILKSNK
jgi:hypothetical protein